MKHKRLRRIVALPASILLAMAVYYIATLGQSDSSDTPAILAAGTFVTSMIAFLYGMRRPHLR